MTRTLPTLLVVLAIALIAALPVLGDNYLLRLGTMFAMYAVLAYSWNVIGGFAGYPSFATAAFFGLGAYGAALAVKWFGAPMETALPAGLLLAGLGAALIGAFVVRLSGIYLAMMTLAAA